jgi:hypothetical protein
MFEEEEEEEEEIEVEREYQQQQPPIFEEQQVDESKVTKFENDDYEKKLEEMVLFFQFTSLQFF